MTNREIKRRIGTVKETMKITDAMYSISMAKTVSTRASLEAADRYDGVTARMMENVAGAFPDHPLFKERGARTGYIVVTSDKGLCGDYNQLVADRAREEILSAEERYVFTVGSTGRDMLAKSGIEADAEYLRGTAVHTTSESVARDMLDLYMGDMLDVVKVVYTDVKGQADATKTILPIRVSPRHVEVDPLVPSTAEKCALRYLTARMRAVLLNAALSEHVARARVMSQATDNAEEMIGDLTAKYNRARQESITRALQDVGSNREV